MCAFPRPHYDAANCLVNIPLLDWSERATGTSGTPEAPRGGRHHHSASSRGIPHMPFPTAPRQSPAILSQHCCPQRFRQLRPVRNRRSHTPCSHGECRGLPDRAGQLVRTHCCLPLPLCVCRPPGRTAPAAASRTIGHARAFPYQQRTIPGRDRGPSTSRGLSAAARLGQRRGAGAGGRRQRQLPRTALRGGSAAPLVSPARPLLESCTLLQPTTPRLAAPQHTLS